MISRLLRAATAPAALRGARRFAASGAGPWALSPALAQRFNEEELKVLKQKFESLRSPGGSSITLADVQRVGAQQGLNLDAQTAQVYIKEADVDGDGVVSWTDFVNMMWDLKAGNHSARIAKMCFPQRSLWDDEEVEQLFRNNREWVARMKAQDPEYFSKLKAGQQPQYLFIGCADSRVPAQELMQMKAGEMFVHRNVANLVVNSDLNLLSVIAYAVEVLKVKDIIVCGHYDCGGVRAAHTPKDHGLVEHWIRNIRDVARLHAAELATIQDPVRYHQRMVELNVQEQCLNLFANPIIQRRQAEHGLPRIHGFVYDVGEGLLKCLNIDFRSRIEELRNIYDTGHFAEAKAMAEWGSRVHSPNDTSK